MPNSHKTQNFSQFMLWTFSKKNSEPHQSVIFHRIWLKFVLKIQDTLTKLGNIYSLK